MRELETTSLPELAHPEALHRRRRRRRSKRFRPIRRAFRRIAKLNWRVGLAVFGGVLAVFLMSALVLASNASTQVKESWASLERILHSVNSTPGTDLTLADFERLQSGLNDLEGSLKSARRQTMLLRPFAPLYGDLKSALISLDAAQELVMAATDMLNGLQPTLFFLAQGEEDEAVVAQLSGGERVVELIGLGRGRFLDAEEHLEKATELMNRLDLAGVSPDMLVQIDELFQQHAYLTDINNTLLEAPELLRAALGLGETQTYLVLSQNSDELRPSGGYISTYGWMTVRNGRILDYNYSATTTTSPNPPPEHMADEIALPDWWLHFSAPIYAAWDGSWYADFPSTARMAAWYYDNGRNPEAPVDGVIGIDMVGFEYLLEGLGSVTVPAYNETVTPANFREAVYRIRAEGRGDREHKQFIAALYRQIMSDWQTVDQERSAAMRYAILRAVQEKHIMLYFVDERVNEAFDVFGWSGAQEPATEHDYLMVADANLGSKSSRSVIRQLTYDVQIQPDGSLSSRASVGYDYPARIAEQDPAIQPEHYGSDINYNNLFQVFVPANSTLIETNNLDRDPTVVASDTHTAFVSLSRLEYNHSERYQFSYTTPVLVEQVGPYQRYRLLIQKQPGTLSEMVNVQVTLPAEAEVVSTSPEAAASYELEQPVLEFRIELLTDKWIEVLYAPGDAD